MVILNDPLVSVIMPNYNSAKYIGEAISSVVNQSYRSLELIVIDDNSTDYSIHIIEQYKERDERIRLIKMPNNIGVGLARNEGLKIAAGKYITFLDSDDLWEINKLEIQISIMERLSLAVTHTDYGYLNGKGEIVSSTFTTSYNEVGYNELLKRTEISCLTVVYNRETVGIHWFPDIKRKQDYVVWLNILKNGYKSVPLHFVSGYYRQQSVNKTVKRLSYIYSHFVLLKGDYIQLSLLKSIYYTFCYFFNGVFRYIRVM